MTTNNKKKNPPIARIKFGRVSANIWENKADDGNTFHFIWMHPPYWRMIKYNDDSRCLSNAETLDDFLNQLQAVIRNCRRLLTPRGKLVILIGGFSNHGRYIPLPHLTVQRAIAEGLWPACTEIIRLQHGNTSSRKTYTSSFIPGLHDTCLVFEHDTTS